MKRKTYEETKEIFVASYFNKNWPEAIFWSTELLQRFEDELIREDAIARVWDNRGTCIQHLGHKLDAIMNFDKALEYETDPDLIARIYCNKGAAYYDMEDFGRAVANLLESIKLVEIPQALLTLGNVHKHNGDLKKALNYYQRCIEADPEYADGHLVYGMALLKAGYLMGGWKEYEWRWKTEQLPARKLKCPQWNGEDLTDKNILVYGEQGLGDIIQFSRYADRLANRFPRAKVFIEGRPPLKRLLETIPNVYAVINVGEKLPQIDYAIPMITLAGMLTPNIGSISANTPEFFLNHRDVEAWREKFNELPQGFRIGVCWSGLSRSNNKEAMNIDSLRSIELSTFSTLSKIPGILWISLQKGLPSEQIKKPPSGMTIVDYTEDMYDFYETCCAIENCDLVISVDTSVAHAAASIGKPTWVLSRWDGCWRWFGDREDSPWYQSLRQFVQPEPHDWEGLMKNVAIELTKLVRDKDQEELDLTLAK